MAQKKQIKKSTVKLTVIMSAIAVVLLAVGITCVYFITDYLRDAEGTGRTAGEAVFAVESGDTLSGLGERLQESGIIKSSLYFNVYLKLEGSDTSLRTGSYYLSKNMSYDEILRKLDGEPDVHNAETLKFTIPEGYRQKQIVALLASKTGRTEDSFNQAIKKVKDEHELLRSLPERAFLLEGYLYPDTYEIFVNEQPESIISRLVDNFFKKAEELELISRAQAKGFTLDEVLTLGSVIELETTNKNEMYEISGVLKNRLDIGMKLQVDPSVIYAHYIETGELLTKVLYEHLEIDSLYNTYKYEGVPYGPICCPRIEALDAVLEPVESDYLFYIFAEGKTYFAKTYDEHLANVDKYLR